MADNFRAADNLLRWKDSPGYTHTTLQPKKQNKTQHCSIPLLSAGTDRVLRLGAFAATVVVVVVVVVRSQRRLLWCCGVEV